MKLAMTFKGFTLSIFQVLNPCRTESYLENVHYDHCAYGGITNISTLDIYSLYLGNSVIAINISKQAITAFHQIT